LIDLETGQMFWRSAFVLMEAVPLQPVSVAAKPMNTRICHVIPVNLAD